MTPYASFAESSGAAAGSSVHILMYHAISSGAGPTCISPADFETHLDILGANGYSVASLADFVSWHQGRSELPLRTAVITFDDGYEDFATDAFPALKRKGWTATVFVPTDRVGGPEDWMGRNNPPRRLLGWESIRELAAQGIDFGSHTRTHPDLTKLPLEKANEEIRGSKETLERELGAQGEPASREIPIAFAAPYGRTTPEIRAAIRRWYPVSVGTELRRADRSDDRYNVPRIEMHYFRDPRRWDAFLAGKGELYFAARRFLRRVRVY